MKHLCILIPLLVLAVFMYMFVMHGSKMKNPSEVDAVARITKTDDHGHGNIAIVPQAEINSNSVATLEFEIRQADRVLDFKGHDAERWGYGILRSIDAVPVQSEQKRLAAFYLDTMETLQPLSPHHKDVSKSLYNTMLLWPTFMALQSKLDDKERPIRLMYKTLLFYRQAVLKYAEDARDNRAGKNGYTQDTIRQLKSDLETWCKIAMNAYIPSAEKCNLSHERHVYWEKVFKSMLDK